MVNDPIADLLTRIRNASRAGHPTVNVPASTTKMQVLKVLQDEGYIERYEMADEGTVKKQIKVFIRYTTSGKPVIQQLRRLSSPGKRVYVRSAQIPKNKSGLGVVIVSTSSGMMSDREARKQGIGGELVCSVF